VFVVKGRPADHPLIAHVLNAEAAVAWASHVPPYARAIMDEHWPGPLTLVFPRSALAANFITGGQDTVAVRVPGSPMTREVLRTLCSLRDDPNAAIAAPSANRFGRVSPTTAQHAIEELGELLDTSDVVLDAGPCSVGVESTIVDCTGDRPVLLRPGKVSAKQIQQATGLDFATSSSVRAPGTLASHYSPHTPVQVVSEAEFEAIDTDATVGVIALAQVPTPSGAVRLTAPPTIEAYAACLYRALREADSLQLTKVLAVAPDGEGLATAIRDRLQRAAAG
jgi:L-threonylcarbamoyladenylate synthase